MPAPVLTIPQGARATNIGLAALCMRAGVILRGKRLPIRWKGSLALWIIN